MNVVREDTDALMATIRVKVTKDDYAEKVEKSLKDYRKKANIKGFRPGMAPIGLIRKMYYRYVLVEEVSKLASDSMMEYIEKENVKILGEPIPSEKQQPIDWEGSEEFEFAWDLGLSPEFELKFNKRNKFPFYKIKVNDELRTQHIESYLNKYGKYVPAEVADEKGLVRVTLTELNDDQSPRDGGINVDEAPISIALVADKEEQKKLIGTKNGDVIVIDTVKAFPNETDRAALLHVKKKELADVQPLFQLTITDVQAFQHAEVNQELWDQVFGKDTVKSEEEFNNKIDEELEQYLNSESEKRFAFDLKQLVIDKLKFDLPKEFLIRWLVASNEGKFSREQIENEYPLFEKDLKWQLVSSRVAQEQGFKVTDEELREFAMGYARSQFAQYGMNFLPEEYITRYANDILKNRDEVRKIHESILDKKVIDWFKETVTLNVKEVTVEEFNKLGQKK